MNNKSTLRNRLHNVTNPYQGNAKKVLCVCSAGLLRSPTLANVLHKEYGHNTRAVGAVESFALIPLDEVTLAWADEIIFVDKHARNDSEANIKDLSSLIANKKQITLSIPDCYPYMDEALIKAIKEQYANA